MQRIQSKIIDADISILHSPAFHLLHQNLSCVLSLLVCIRPSIAKISREAVTCIIPYA